MKYIFIIKNIDDEIGMLLDTTIVFYSTTMSFHIQLKLVGTHVSLQNRPSITLS